MIRRTDSRNFNDRMEEISNNNNQVSSHSISIAGRQKRVPDFMKNTIKGIMLEAMAINSGLAPASMKQSAVGNAIKNRIKNTVKAFKNLKNCQICEAEIPKPKNKNLEVYMCECDHKFNFCESCLHHYVIYKVKNFEEVLCPSDGCPATLDMTTNFFKNLPADIQKNYRKIYQFYLTSKDPTIKLCPRQNCEGIIRKEDETVMYCNECNHRFCPKCLLDAHEGECDNQELKFFEGNLHYRQCKKCKMVVEKTQGCNHITCKCAYEFCYVCGEKWSPEHYGNHDQNGRVIPVPDLGPAERARLNNYENDQLCDCNCDCCGCDCDCCGCNCDCDCRCCQDCCGQTCVSIMKFPLKLLLYMLFLCLMLLIFASRDLMVILTMTFVCMISGMFGFTCEILSDLEGIQCFLAVLFFPVTMIAGIIKAFQQIYCEMVGDMFGQFCNMFCDGSRQVWEI